MLAALAPAQVISNMVLPTQADMQASPDGQPSTQHLLLSQPLHQGLNHERGVPLGSVIPNRYTPRRPAPSAHP